MKPSSDRRTIGSSDFELVALFQARRLNNCKWHGWGQVQRSVLVKLPRFLTLWKDADPDIPILKEAKAEYAKLK
jgi:hypothetical protein